jgi:hypothetical protein
MIFKLGKTDQQKRIEKEKKKDWHKWFAWHPVNVGEEDGRNRMAWLCTVYRILEPNLVTMGYHWRFSVNIDEVMKETLVEK